MRQNHLRRRVGVGTNGASTRANALWGKGRRRYPLLTLTLTVAVVAIAAGTVAASPDAAPKKGFVPDSLRKAAKSDPTGTFQVIVQASDSSQLDALGDAVDKSHKKHPGKARGLRKKFKLIPAVSAEINGDQLDDLAASDGVLAVTEDAPIHATALGNTQNWTDEVGVQWAPAPRRASYSTSYPTIAIVDSGVQSRGDFGRRLDKQVDFTSGGGNSSGDGFGHGTLVAGLAAGGKDGFTGAEPNAHVVSLDVLDDTGAGRVSDVVDACDWILQNKDRYNIRIANFSINAGGGVGAGDDPLDRAVEKLWLNGIVVVAAAGNYAVDGAESGVGFAPANDPFVITVGAADTGSSGDTER